MAFSSLQSYFYRLQIKSDTPDLLLKPKVNIKRVGTVPEVRKGEAVLFRVKQNSTNSIFCDQAATLSLFENGV